MKLFLIWPGGPEVKVLYEELVKAGNEIVYYVGVKQSQEFVSSKVFHDHYEAWDSKPAFGVPTSKFVPPGKKLLRELAETESVVLTMMNKRYDNLCVDERKFIYYEMVKYWNGVLDLYKPEAIIFSGVPHAVYDFILYSLAKIRNLKTTLVEDTWISDRSIIYTDYKKSNQKFFEAVNNNKDKHFSLNEISVDLKEHYEWQMNKETNPTPLYMNWQKNALKKSSFLGIPYKGIFNALKNRSFLSMFSLYINKHFLPNLKSEYKKLQKQPDWDKNYIYMPMSFQPERTSSPQSDVFVNQLLAVETLASTLPEGWEIYLKEHPSQWMIRTKEAYSSARWKGYYDRLSKMPKVRLIPVETSTFTLIKNSKALSVVAGTAGWEAMLRNKPVINFGFTWYRDLEGIFNVEDSSSCRDAINKIIGGFRVDQDMVFRNIKSLDQASTHGYIEATASNQSKLNHNEATLNLAKVIIDELSKK